MANHCVIAICCGCGAGWRLRNCGHRSAPSGSAAMPEGKAVQRSEGDFCPYCGCEDYYFE